MKLKILTVGHISHFDSTIVCNVLSQVLFSLYVESCLLVKEVAVLAHDAVGSQDVLFCGCIFPPVSQVPIFIKKST